MGSKIESAITWAVDIANDDTHGYDQASRWGPDYDCSSFVISAFQQAGVPVKTQGASSTANMYTVFKKCGFSDVTNTITLSSGSGLKRGDVLLKPSGHTALFIGSGQIVHASINEKGTTTGGKTGDQTGKEICVTSYYNKPWTYVLRYEEEDTSSWHAKVRGEYARTSNEAIENAKLIYQYLGSLGWTLNAVCGLLGNIGKESGYNPWRWQGDKVGATTGSPWTNKGYGFVQFTPAGNYINSSIAKSADGYAPNFSDKSGNASDAEAQLYCISTNFNGGYFINPKYNFPLTWTEFKASTEDAGYLAKAWLHNYERPKDQGTSVENVRAEEAEYWYEILSGETPPTPTPTKLKVTVTISGGSGCASAWAEPNSGLEEGDEVELSYDIESGEEEEDIEFIGWTVVSGGVKIVDDAFTMGSQSVIINARFTGKDVPPSPVKADKTFKIWFTKPAWVRNLGM